MVTSPTPASSVDPALSALLASTSLSTGGDSGVRSGGSAEPVLVEGMDRGPGELRDDFLASLEAVAVGGSGAVGEDVSPLQVKINSVRD